MGKIKSKAVDAVIVYKLDRLSRKVIDTLTLIETIEKAGVTFHSLNEKIDTGTAMGRFFLNITASLAQMERDLISERTKDALQMKISRNERAGQIPYGWKLAEGNSAMIRDDREQAAIKRMKSLHAEGCTLRGICRDLEAEGYQPKGSKWHPKTINSILKKAA